jgi:hypothetical protein
MQNVLTKIDFLKILQRLFELLKDVPPIYMLYVHFSLNFYYTFFKIVTKVVLKIKLFFEKKNISKIYNIIFVILYNNFIN